MKKATWRHLLKIKSKSRSLSSPNWESNLMSKSHLLETSASFWTNSKFSMRWPKLVSLRAPKNSPVKFGRSKLCHCRSMTSLESKTNSNCDTTIFLMRSRTAFHQRKTLTANLSHLTKPMRSLSCPGNTASTMCPTPSTSESTSTRSDPRTQCSVRPRTQLITLKLNSLRISDSDRWTRNGKNSITGSENSAVSMICLVFFSFFSKLRSVWKYKIWNSFAFN